MDFSVMLEIVAALIIVLLLLYSFDEGSTANIGNQRFRFCLYVTLLAIMLDVLSVYGIREYETFPVWVNMLISSLNYLVASLNSVVIASYLSHQIFEHFPKHFCRKKITIVIWSLYGIVVASVAVNLFNNCLFSFGNQGYIRGPLNLLGYLVVMFEVVMVGLCYLKNSDIASRSMRKAMRSIPYVVCGILIWQLICRDTMMNGLIAAMVDLILFISFQSRRNNTDYLTNLGNRGVFVEDLGVLCESQKRLHIIMLYLNKFGRVNREFGQKNGDEFLYAVARYLDNLSPAARAYRLGSLEFAIICREEEDASYLCTVNDIRERFAKPWEIGDMKATLSVSVSDLYLYGTAESGQESREADNTRIIEQLEYAMRLAKAEGENGWVPFDRKVRMMMERQKSIIEQMRETIANKSFSVYYQPIYCWKDGLFCSAEALARMSDKEGNPIPPSEFITLAESTGMINELNWIIVEKVCAFVGSHPELKLKGIAINMSIRQFMEEGMKEKLDRILDKYGVSHEILKIEITERVISENPVKAREIMESLTAEGIRFYLDDFGMGYSNFASVLSLPFDTIKLDKTLTDKALGTPKERQIFHSLVEMFLKARYSIVAEGAETEEMVEELTRLQVDRIQGYYYSKPLPEEEYLQFMEDQK